MKKILFIAFFTISCVAKAENEPFKFKDPVKLAITVDDVPAAGPELNGGSRAEVARKMIAAFKKYKVPTVYGFVNGYNSLNMAARLEIVKKWTQAGFLIGNHTFNHSALTDVKAEDYIKDIELVEPILLDYAKSIKELKVFRYPYLMEGDTLEKRYAVRSYLSKRNYIIAQVTVDTMDWDFNLAYVRCKNQKKDTKFIEERYFKTLEKSLKYFVYLSKFIYGEKTNYPQILLMHMNYMTAELIDKTLEKLKAMNVVFVSAVEAINAPVFREDPSIKMASGTPYYEQIRLSRKLQFNEYSKPDDIAEWTEDLCKN